MVYQNKFFLAINYLSKQRKNKIKYLKIIIITLNLKKVNIINKQKKFHITKKKILIIMITTMKKVKVVNKKKMTKAFQKQNNNYIQLIIVEN